MIDAATHLGFILALSSSQPADEPANEATASPTAEVSADIAQPEPLPAEPEQPTPTTDSAAESHAVSTRGEAEPPLVAVAPPPPTKVSPDDDDPSAVIRPHAGHWGMHFSFGGLAPMSIGGLNDVRAGRLMFTELGVRRAFDNGWALPFSAGVGWVGHNPDEDEAQNDAGLSISIGVRKSFRVWRRIAPYTGGDVRVMYADPEGDDNRRVGLAFGPNLGIEYFVADRVSLLLQGDLTLALTFAEQAVTTDLATRVSGGGQMGLVFYF